MDSEKETYFSELKQTTAKAWNDFWFTSADVSVLCVLRILVGILALYFVVSHSADLVRWFGPDGLLPFSNVAEVESLDATDMPAMRFSYFALTESPQLLWTMHVVAIVAVAAFTVGFYTRFTSVWSLVAVLSYVHRGPFLTGQFEPILTLMLFYLCLAPCGHYLSVDAWLASRREDPTKPKRDRPAKSIAANLALRLMQVHISLLYLTMCLSKLTTVSWVDGGAVWYLIALPNNGLLDLKFLHNTPLVVNFWTHLVVLFEGLFAVLIWVRPLRPLLLVWACIMWVVFALITGLVSFAVAILVAGLVFSAPETMQSVVRWAASKIGATANFGDAPETSATAA